MNLKKTLLTLAMLCSGSLLGPAAAEAQTVVVEVDVRLCALLPYELQSACYSDFSSGSATRGEAIRVCSNLSSSYYRNECYGVIQGADYSYAALTACSRMNNDYAALECLRSTRNGYYQAEAMSVCSAMASTYSQGECFKTVRNKVYDRYELEACGREISDYSRSQCMERFGRRVNTGGGSYPAPYPRDPQPLPRPAPQDPASCEVHNSNSYITTVARSRFLTYAKQFARENKSCVVSNNYNEERTRTLIDANGRVLGSGLSESEANNLKASYGYNRCRILTCK